MSDKLVEYCPICEKPINQKDDKHLDICKGCQNNMYNTVCQNDKFNKRKKQAGFLSYFNFAMFKN